MPAPPPENGPSAGISSPEEVDVAALFARLQEELRSAGAQDPRDGRPSNRVPARAAAGRFWPVSAERPLQRTPGFRGAIKRWAQRVLRRTMRWYVEPLAADQRSFNDAALKLIDDLYELVDSLSDRAERTELERAADSRLLREIDERVKRLERRRSRPEPAVEALPQQPAPPAPLDDYFAFESRMRPAEIVREHQRFYVDDFREQEPVLDIGCGRGELLGLLREAGIQARGIDSDPDMVDFAAGEGLDVEQADALAYLERLEDDSLGGIFAGQVVEHMPPGALVRFLELGRAKLRPGGLFVAETINPLSPIALRHYFADLTHAQPLVAETLELLVRQAGFGDVETRYLNEPEQRLDAPDDPVLAKNVARLNEVVFAPLDYAVLARA